MKETGQGNLRGRDLKIIYFRIMVNGKRETMRSPFQGAAAISANGKQTNKLKKLVLNWRYKLMNKDYDA